MKCSLQLIAAAMLAVLPSCDKVRDLAGKVRGRESGAPAKPYAGELVSEISESGFDAFRQQAGRVVLIDFYADWCGPCRKLAPVLHDIAAEKDGLVLVGKVNVDRCPELAAGNGVRGIPDVRIFRDGKQVDQFVGMPAPAEIRRRIEKQLEGLPPPSVKVADPAPTPPASADGLPPGMQRR